MKKRWRSLLYETIIGLKKSFFVVQLAGVFFLSATPLLRAEVGGVGESSLEATYELQQPVITVSGQVVDKGGEPIPGVSIVVSGTTQGTITDMNGRYRLSDVPSDGVLAYSFIAMKTQEIQVGGQTTINVTMEEEILGLDEVVVVGYGSQKKATLTGSVETVSADAFEDRAVTSPALALQGQTPGLVVTRSSARPGNEGIDFQIRGATSVNGGDPLIVIDGSPAINNEAFYNMNSDDIESISVLKDGSAAIYGSRASNGVILVTTKRGTGKMKVNLNSSIRINTIGIRPPSPTMEEYASLWLQAGSEDGQQANYWGWQSRENLEKMQSGYEGIYPTEYWGDIYIGNYPRFDEMYDTSVSNQHRLSLSGASDNSSYRLSMGYAEDVGNLQTSYDGKQQYNVRFNYDYDVTDWLKLETGVAYLNYHVSSPSGGLDASSISVDPPFFPAQNPYGQWYANFNIAGNRNAVANTVDGGRENTKRDQMKLNFAVEADLYKDLSFRGTASFDKDFYQYQMYQITVPQYTWYGELAPESVNSTSSIRERNRQISYENYGVFLNYEKRIEDHNISAMVGSTAEMRKDKNLYGYRKGFDDFGVYDLNLGSEENLVEADGGAGNWGLYSYVARFNYNFKEKYLLELNGRRDGSSKFHEDYRWSNFGGGSLGWIVTEESFMDGLDILSFLKLRASYGEMGNQVGIGNHDYLSSMNFGTAIFGVPAAQQTAAYLGGLTSYSRTWERVGIATYGLDFQLLNGSVFGSFDYYEKENDGMLIGINYPDLLGGNAPKSNDGILETKGWEATIGYRGKAGDFEYNVALNMSDSENELVSMEGMDSWSAGKVSLREGFPINSYFLYQTDGFFEDEAAVQSYYDELTSTVQGEIPSSSDANQRLRPGDTRIIDLDGNGYISDVGDGVNDTGDVKFMGDASPHYVYGINLGGKYKNIDFSAFFQGALEHNILRTNHLSYPFYVLWSNQTNAFMGETWTEENKGAEYPRLTSNTNRARWNWQNNDFMLQNNRYIRLKSLVLGYTFNDIKVSQYNLEKLRVYFSGNDLFELTSVKDGFDPEYGESSTSSYPFNRTWSFGVNIIF